MKKTLMFAVLGIAVLAVSLPAMAGKVYFYVDQKGAYHFSDRPKDKNYDQVMMWKDGGDIDVLLLHDKEINSIISSACRLYGVDVALVKAIIRVESNWDHKAVSRAGAQGLMQLMPTTAQLVRVNDSFDPKQNIFGGVCYFKSMLLRFNGDVKLALAAYNAGPNAVDKYNGIPPYEETRNYVRLVLQYWEYYKKKEAPGSSKTSYSYSAATSNKESYSSLNR